MGSVRWLGAVSSGWYNSGCGTGPRARWLPNGLIEIEGEGTPFKSPEGNAFSKDVIPWFDLIAKMAVKYDVPAHLVAGIMSTESGGKQQAHTSCCYGLMGLFPPTAKTMAGRTVSPDELLNNPALNIELGTKFISYLLKKYDGNFIKVATAYNSGGAYCSPAKSCTTTNRWGMRADCVSGKTIDYPTRVIAYSNGALMAEGSVSPVAPASRTEDPLLWVAGAMFLGAVGLAWWSGKRGTLRGNPLRKTKDLKVGDAWVGADGVRYEVVHVGKKRKARDQRRGTFSFLQTVLVRSRYGIEERHLLTTEEVETEKLQQNPAQDIEAAVKAWRLYSGSTTAGVRDADKLYRQAMRKTEAVAKKRGMNFQDVFDQITAEAQRRGSLSPLPGKDY